MTDARSTAAGHEREDWHGDFARFVANDGDRLLRAAFGMCGDWQHAEDLVQAALTKLAVKSGASRALAKLRNAAAIQEACR